MNKLHCPICENLVDEEKLLAHTAEYGNRIIKEHHQRIGAAGGLAGIGKAKARTKEQASSAAKKRWAKVAKKL